MERDRLDLRLLVAVGSRNDRVCSVGAFARAEAAALAQVFKSVDVLEPDAEDAYPLADETARPDVILFHAPSLHDRKRPWNALVSAMVLKHAFPKARFVSVVHEYSEAPLHWKARQIALLKLSHGAIVNSDADRAGVSRWIRKLLRTRLGPTLFRSDLLAGGDVAAARDRARTEIVRRQRTRLGLEPDEQWLVHPGLITPGKGVDFLARLAPVVSGKRKLIVMGGLGPKARDRDFAKRTITELNSAMKGRVVVLEAPDDDAFREMLLAADLVVLPYDAGVSERRSSFLSPMSCGANVWTTAGEFTPALAIESSGAHSVRVGEAFADPMAAVRSIEAALTEPPAESAARRARNLEWAKGRSWENRAVDIRAFIASL
jgi:hypothetical protein